MGRSAAETRALLGRVIFGGSFNPLHCGHMRLALETLDRLRHWVSSLEFLPVARPAHKDALNLLPFALRVAMIRESVAPFHQMGVNELEASREGTSWTYESLAGLGSPCQLYFLVGSQDFALFPQWYRGLELLQVANIVVVPRGDMNRDTFLDHCFAFFGEVEMLDPNLTRTGSGSLVLRHSCGQKIFWLPVPHLAISASYVRQCWLSGRSIDYLVPGPVQAILNREERAALACWEGSSAPCSM